MSTGTGTISLRSAMSETNSPACTQVCSDFGAIQCAVDATHGGSGSRDGVGQSRHSHGFMDSVIDLLEVIEMDMHHKGEHRLAIYAKTLRGTYLARRITQGAKQ